MERRTLTYSGHLLPTMCAVFSSDGELIASGGGDRTVKVWKAADGRDILPLKDGHSALVHCVAFSPDGKFDRLASWDRTVIIWDAKNGEKLRIFDKHSDRVQSVAFSPDGRHRFDQRRQNDASVGSHNGPRTPAAFLSLRCNLLSRFQSGWSARGLRVPGRPPVG